MECTLNHLSGRHMKAIIVPLPDSLLLWQSYLHWQRICLDYQGLSDSYLNTAVDIVHSSLALSFGQNSIRFPVIELSWFCLSDHDSYNIRLILIVPCSYMLLYRYITCIRLFSLRSKYPRSEQWLLAVLYLLTNLIMPNKLVNISIHNDTIVPVVMKDIYPLYFTLKLPPHIAQILICCKHGKILLQCSTCIVLSVLVHIC